jgi:hypothetical protein
LTTLKKNTKEIKISEISKVNDIKLNEKEELSPLKNSRISSKIILNSPVIDEVETPLITEENEINNEKNNGLNLRPKIEESIS